MFEAFAVVCALASAPLDGSPSAPEICRTALFPGHAAQTLAVCEKGALSRPRQWPGLVVGEPFCRSRPTSSLEFDEVAPGLFVHRGEIAEVGSDNLGDIANLAFLVGEDRIAVVDAGGSRQIGEQVYLAIRQRSELPISHLILTHMHPDHVFGAEVFREAGAQIVGQQNLPRALAEREENYQASFTRLIGEPGMLGSRIVPPDHTVEDSEAIDLGGRQIELRAWPTAHTVTDLTVLDRKTATLLAGDLLFDQHTPALDGSVKGWRHVLQELMAIKVDRVIPGHGGPVLPWPQGGLPLERYLAVLEEDTRAALAKGVPLSAATEWIGRSEANRWQLFDLYNPRNATAAYTELEWD